MKEIKVAVKTLGLWKGATLTKYMHWNPIGKMEPPRATHQAMVYTEVCGHWDSKKAEMQ